MKDKIVIRSSFKDVAAFTAIPSYRSGVINEAPSEIKHINYAVNSNAAFLHPAVQNLVIKSVLKISPDVKLFVLEPDVSQGTVKLAYFRPGQYIPIKFKIGSALFVRPFTLCASPTLSQTGDEYLIHIKKTPFDAESAYIFDNWEKGTRLSAGAPDGTFYYQPLRDEKNIVGITDDFGAAPFYAMACAVADGLLDIELTLIYGCRKKSDAVFMDEFIALSQKTEKFKPIFVFSDEKIDKCERGFITKALLEKYAPAGKFSVFINGSSGLYTRTAPHISAMRLEKKYVRFGSGDFGKDFVFINGFPEKERGKIYLCKVIKDKKIMSLPCRSDETLLAALEREGIDSNACCNSGECGKCRAKLLKGNVFIPKVYDRRRRADIAHGIIYTCSSYPISNVTISFD